MGIFSAWPRARLPILDGKSLDREHCAVARVVRLGHTDVGHQMSGQIERSREKLQRSRNERESNAAQREVEELRKLHRDREEELERLTTAADGARTSISDAEAKRLDAWMQEHRS